MTEQTYLDTLIDTLEAGGDPQPPAPESNTADLVAGVAEARDRYRGERDEARAERDAYAARIETMQRAEVERLAAEHLSHASDFFTFSGNGIADYLDENGNVDPDKVEADARVIVSERPGLAPRVWATDPTQGAGGPPPGRLPTMADLINS
ncbi:Uncharacterised protein [Mycolicibacterium fortuitum]|uniref:Uncharacterized protein n=1 Tax=Mycolicibacterium fortuitum TaxID=1766 RepID=A0A378V0W0_MYCFO|nr:Uncharacterised protein [Mycolicibacterium fortuitum]